MNARESSPGAVYQTIQATSKITGLSPGYLRSGVRAGRIAHVRVGSIYLVNVPRLLTMLDEEATANSGEGAARTGRERKEDEDAGES